MKIHTYVLSQIALLGFVGGLPAYGDEPDTSANTIVQYGEMHEAIGQKQHQGRVELRKLTKGPHFFAVAALEGLQGEATIYSGKPTVTTVDKEGHLQAVEPVPKDAMATMLVGAYVPVWSLHQVKAAVPADAFDDYIAAIGKENGFHLDKPFMFRIEGEFTTAEFHVINGACPIHARMKKIELQKELQSFEAELPKVSGKLVGVFAKDAVGKLTHPATSTHTHLIYTDLESGKLVTGHVEKIGLQQGAVLMLPARQY